MEENMRQYKKILQTVLLLAAALAMVLSFAGCGGGGGGGGDSFTISYNANGAESGSAPKAQTGSGSELTIQGNTGNMAKGGYLFDDWNTKADGTGKSYASGVKYKGDDLTLYADWAAIFNVQQIGGGSPSPALNGVQKAPGSSTLKILGLTEKGMTLVDIEIPEAIDGETVTAIANGAFQDCSHITSIIIPATVTSIEANAFAGCTGASIVLEGTTPPAIEAGAFDPGAAIYVPDSATSAYTSDPAWSAYTANIEGYDPAVGVLTGIAVTSAPTKVLYAIGESFSSAGLVVTATYSDASSQAVNSYSMSPADTSTAGIKTLTITYSERGITKSATAKYYVKRNDAITESPVSAGGDLYKFGDFPQTVSAISEYSDAPVYNGWYLGSDGYFYDKVKAFPYDNDIDTDTTFSNSIEPVYGQEYFFKVEPIQWKKLTDNYNSSGKALLLSDKILRGTNGYNNDGGIVYYYTAQTERTIGGNTVYANNYKYSSVRAYLNGSYESGDPQATTYNGAGFLQKAFTATAQGKIATTVVKNDEENMRGNYNNNDEAKLTAYKSDNTNDKVFLLSAFGPEYTLLYTSGERQRSPSDYALATRVRRTDGQTGGFWLTRTPECDEDYPSNKAPDVSPYRYAVLHYNSNGNPNYADTDNPGIVGIAPAITIDPSYLP